MRTKKPTMGAAPRPAPPKAEEPVPPARPDAAAEAKAEKIRRLAYERWEAAGKPEGADVWFWLEAERELLRARG